MCKNCYSLKAENIQGSKNYSLYEDSTAAGFFSANRKHKHEKLKKQATKKLRPEAEWGAGLLAPEHGKQKRQDKWAFAKQQLRVQ
jgi:hypothetical protein